jgi:hypothetical protein
VLFDEDADLWIAVAVAVADDIVCAFASTVAAKRWSMSACVVHATLVPGY